MSENNTTTLITLGAAAGTLVGMTAMLIAQKTNENSIKQQKIERIKARKQKYIEQQRIEAFINGAQNQQKLKRRVHLMFNDNDEMVEREEDETFLRKTPKDENPSELNADKLK